MKNSCDHYAMLLYDERNSIRELIDVGNPDVFEPFLKLFRIFGYCLDFFFKFLKEFIT